MKADYHHKQFTSLAWRAFTLVVIDATIIIWAIAFAFYGLVVPFVLCLIAIVPVGIFAFRSFAAANFHYRRHLIELLTNPTTNREIH